MQNFMEIGPVVFAGEYVGMKNGCGSYFSKRKLVRASVRASVRADERRDAWTSVRTREKKERKKNLKRVMVRDGICVSNSFYVVF